MIAGGYTLWSSGDVCRYYRVSRMQLMRWTRMRGFPDPIMDLGNRGRVWDANAIREWKRTRDRQHLKVKGLCIGRYRQTRDVDQTAKEYSVPPSTLRAWLIDNGDLPEPTSAAA